MPKLAERLVTRAFAGAALTPEGVALMSRDLHLDMSRARRELRFASAAMLEEGCVLTLGYFA